MEDPASQQTWRLTYGPTINSEPGLEPLPLHLRDAPWKQSNIEDNELSSVCSTQPDAGP